MLKKLSRKRRAAAKHENETLVTRLALRSLDDHQRKDFGLHLDKLMREHDINQSELARRCFGETDDPRGSGTGKVSKGRDRISKYVRGIAFPDHKTLESIANAFNITVGELLPSVVRNALAETQTTHTFGKLKGHPLVKVTITQVCTIETAKKIQALLEADEEEAESILNIAARKERKQA